MSQPIVLLATPPSRRFHQKSKNDLLLKIRVGNLELSLYQALSPEMMARGCRKSVPL